MKIFFLKQLIITFFPQNSVSKNKNLRYSLKFDMESLCLCVQRLHKKFRLKPSYFRYQHYAIKFTKHFAKKYKGNFAFLVFWILLHILFLSNAFRQLRSLCLINTLLLIPILPYFMTSYVMIPKIARISTKFFVQPLYTQTQTFHNDYLGIS